MTTESEVRAVLNNPFDHAWTIQGFGMLRTYLDPHEVERLHIWDTDTAVEHVSTLHNHPWDFVSRIFAGTVTNQRFLVDSEFGGAEYQRCDLRTGEGGGLVAEPTTARVGRLTPPEVYLPGDSYQQDAPEFHESSPTRGAVTVITRNFSRPRDFATVCWQSGEWVSAEPRPATRAEVERFIALAREAMA